MILSITGEAELELIGLKPDNTVLGSKMQSADLVVSNFPTGCIIRHVAQGSIKDLNSSGPQTVNILIPNRVRHTPHTRLGFVDVQITTKLVQLSVYIHVESLGRFFQLFAINTVRAGLKI